MDTLWNTHTAKSYNIWLLQQVNIAKLGLSNRIQKVFPVALPRLPELPRALLFGGRAAALKAAALIAAAAIAAVAAVRYRDISRYKQTKADREVATAELVSRKQALSDVAFLKELMPKTYGGRFETAPEAWRQAFKTLEKSVIASSDDAIATARFAAMIAGAFRIFEDGHLVIDKVGTRHASFVAKPRLVPIMVTERAGRDCLEKSPWQNQGFQKRPYFERQTRTVTTKLIALMPRPLPPSACVRPIPTGGADRRVAIEAPAGDWQYLRLGSSYSKAYYEVFSDAAHKVSATRNLVFDLRGNTGGDNTLDFRLVRALGLPFSNPYENGITHTTSAAIQLQWNAVKWSLARINPELAAQRLAWLEGSLWQHFWGLADDQGVLAIDEDNLGAKQAAAFENHIVIIADGDCMSACESLIKVLKAYEKTILIGTNTTGGVKIGDLATATLPQSKLRISLGRTFNPAFADSAAYRERSGFIPDIWMTTIGISPKEAIEIARHVVQWTESY